MVHVYEKETGRYLYSRNFAPGEGPGESNATTEVAPDTLALREPGTTAYFRNGKWEYEQDDAYTSEEV